ncbi:MAG: M36 family metallopeptidase, partial [Acidobacteria bacterium]|nr:M36 family metallopeptidase [Acidobacteriota bacterium]
MKKFIVAATRHKLLFSFIVFGLLAGILILPYQFRSLAGVREKPQNSFSKTESSKEGLENYDIRTDKNESETLANFRQSVGKSEVAIADTRDKFADGENKLRQRVPKLKVEYNKDIRVPEVIASDVKQGPAFLTAPSAVKPSEVLRGFLKQNDDLLGVTDEQANQLKPVADYTNPDGNLSFAQLDQTINGIRVFRGEVKAGFNKRGEMVRVINNLAPDLDYQNLSTDFHNPLDAVKSAASYINHELKESDLMVNNFASNDLKTVFGKGDWATTAEKIYFPTEPGVARTAWRVLIWQPADAYYIIVDAETGKMLWRKNITDDQTQSATFNVYANTTSLIRALDNPAPLTPGPIDPSLGTQGTIQSRTNVTLIGNEAPFTFNNKGWIADDNNTTDGNAVEAGVDRVAPNGVDAAVTGTNRVFNFNYNPGPGNPSPGDNPLGAEYQKGAVTQMFYVLNRYHDELYLLGFNEAARNFQQDNFGRGGVGNDRISAEGQDSSGSNNANFSTPADGNRGRMQMYLWSAPTPDYDGTLDADVIIHEVTHGTSNRLHGNSSGLASNMARGMGEGWSDFFALAMLSEPTDPIEGIYPTGGYTTYLGGVSGNTKNYYYGIRRFPKAVKSFVGPNGKPHNPLSFRHLNADCNAEIGTPTQIGTTSAFARGPYGSSICDQSHAAGEIWSSALWEVRAKLIARLGWEIGNRKALQYVIDGMKLAPLDPTFLEERDAIIAAAQASGSGDDVADIWEGFRIRGMGFSARIISPSPANVVEAFDSPNLVQAPDFTFTEVDGNNNGFADPGETIVLNIPLSNKTGKTAVGTTLQIGDGIANYGDIAYNQTVSRTVSFTVPVGQSCGSVLTVALNINSSLGPKTEIRSLLIGQPVEGFSQNFDRVAAPAMPKGWTAAPPNPSTGSTAPWQTSATSPTGVSNAAFAPDPGNVYLAQLESPSVSITAAAAKLKFKINYNTEHRYDGTTLDIKIGLNSYQDILAAGGTFVSGAYSGWIGSGGFPNAGRQAWTGNSNGYVDVEIVLPTSANGQNVQFRWNASADTSVSGAGTYIDDVKIISSYVCSASLSSVKSRGDFDGDGRTDVSFFRPNEGNWYLNQSTEGFKAVAWGAATDQPLPG